MIKKTDLFLFINVSVLLLLGLLILASASSYQGVKKFGDSLYYVKHQIAYGVLPGILIFGLAFFFPYRKYKKIAFFLLLAGLFFLILVFTPLGFKSGGAARWVKFGPLSFQPIEFFKVVFIMYLAFWCTRVQKMKTPFTERLIPFLAILGLSIFLVLNQPNTSSAILLLLAALLVYFMSGARVSYIFLIALAGLLALSVVIYATPYRLQRVMTFLNPESDPLGSGYHINQLLLALGSGGVWGVGFGKSTTKVSFLPEPMTDSVFAIIGEEFGFVGAMLFVLFFVFLVVRMFFIARRIKDDFGRILVAGFATMITLQALLNIGAVSGFLPLTGVPLPLVSYGGSSMMAFMAMIGITLNVAKYRD